MTAKHTFLDRHADDWRKNLDLVIQTMREMSSETEPQAMVAAFSRNIKQLRRHQWTMAISRRGFESPRYRITRSPKWPEQINPWKRPDLLPEFDGGILSQLIYSNEAHIIDDLQLADDEPAREYLEGYRSLMAVPNFDGGEALNMVLWLHENPGEFSPDTLPDSTLITNLFGRATHNLVLSDKLRIAYEQVDRQMRVVADIQQSLLPAELPDIPTLDIAVYYQTSEHAGGDYYDFFPLDDGRWGILIADVCGHGTPAAVLMAVTHCLAHTHPQQTPNCTEVLNYANLHLTKRYTADGGKFVTMFYAIYDPTTRELEYASAGHNPPRVKRCHDGSMFSLDQAGDVPLGIIEDTNYPSATVKLIPGDQLVLYTDGITEAVDPDQEQFGTDRLDSALEQCSIDAQGLVRDLLSAVESFTQGAPADDDRTLVVAKVR